MRHTKSLNTILAGLLIAALATPLLADDRDDDGCRMRGGMGRGMHMGEGWAAA